MARKRVLIVDDSATIRAQVHVALAERFEIVEAGDGQEGLDALKGGQVDLVLCDINMPRMNGLEMLARLHGERSPVPVVMLTTEGHPQLIQQARDHGAKGWIVKPFDPALLLKAAERLAG
ncbi:MAG: response regulator [Myxococcales bacterium]|nr:response regulator [Myxococcales bacterium]